MPPVWAAFKSLKNSGFSTSKSNAEIRASIHEFPDRQVFIFLHKRKRLFPKNADLTYMPPSLIEDGKVSHLPIPLLGLVNKLNATRSGGIAYYHSLTMLTSWK